MQVKLLSHIHQTQAHTSHHSSTFVLTAFTNVSSSNLTNSSSQITARLVNVYAAIRL